jgi:uncharacterized surface protein with fasciclin (FAS1) repeats
MANIIETAKGAGCFATLLTAVEVAGLTGALESPGPFTVFAPVDDAFAALPPGTVQTLVDNPPQLARILKFHVLAGAHHRSELVTRPVAEPGGRACGHPASRSLRGEERHRGERRHRLRQRRGACDRPGDPARLSEA